jgi:predicted transcriptional regulator
MDAKQPKVFISHASEDKDRFVMSFSKRLLEHGIDAWVDKWEMLPGDSLVDKIFEDGIKNASAFIIILSKNSVQKPWVREELNAGFIKKLSGKCKVIPVVIDECEIPEALKTTIWERIKDINNYEEEFNRIVASIYEISQKPPIGNPPKYTQSTIVMFPGFSKIDMLVLKTIGDLASNSESPIFGPELVKKELFELEISESQIDESIEFLDDQNFIKGQKVGMENKIAYFEVTTYGFVNYAKVFYSEFESLVKNSLIAIVNKNISTNDDLSKYLNVQKPLINRVLDYLSDNGYFEQSKSYGGGVSIYNISASAKRIGSSQ